jgi:UDP:flavonoid glycosyltransferase YjiC (YdhE family)
VGYVLPFAADDYVDQEAVRKRLGYGSAPLVLCAIGGTAVGKHLLELCGRSFPIAAATISDLRMVLVCGPRLAPASLEVPAGVEIRGYVPGLYEHLAACDLAVVQGGGTVTLELTALRKPFLYFPIEGHSEQEVSVAGRLARHGAGIKLRASRTTPRTLANAMLENIGRPISHRRIPTDGAAVAARAIAEFAGWIPRTEVPDIASIEDV